MNQVRLRRDSTPASVERQRERQQRRRRSSRIVVGLLTIAAGGGGALAGAHPTGTPVVDPLYAAAFAAAVTFACSRAKRSAWLGMSAAAVIMARSWLLVPAVASLGVAFASTFQARSRRRVGAMVGALASQVILRWPHLFFHGFTAVVAVAVVLPCFVSAHHHADQLWRRRLRWGAAGLGGAAVILGGPLAVAGLLARGPVDAGQADAHAALSSVGGVGGRALDTRLAAATADFARAHSLVSPWWTAGAYLVPGEAQQRRTLVPATAAGERVAVAARSLSGPLSALRSSYHGGRVDLSSITALSAPLQHLESAVVAAQHQVTGVGSAWLLPPVGHGLAHLRTDLAKARSSTDLALQAVPVLPPILGSGGTRRYFVAFMTPSESRGLDGFIGSYALLTVAGGRISLSAASDIHSLIASGVPPSQRHLAGPPDYLARYGAYDPAYYLMDLTYSPDFPTVTDVISNLYPQTGGPPIDGVMALDPYALAALLHFTGPVSVPGLPTPLSYRNAAQVLTVGQYLQTGTQSADQAARHDELQYALRAAFAKLTTTSLPSPAALSTRLSPLVRQGRLLFWSLHPVEEALLRRVGLAGAFPNPAGGDLLAVTTNNAANNKLDAYLKRRLDDQVSYNPHTGATNATVTISLDNTAPATGLPPYVAGSYAGSHLPYATNYTWLSIYSPLKLASASVGGAPVPMAATPELGVNAYSTHVIIPAGATVTVTLHLSGHLQPSGTYRLAIRNQPGVQPDADTITVRPTPGWEPAGPITWQANGNLVDDRESVRFDPPPAPLSASVGTRTHA